MRVFVDTDAFCALADEDDQWHAKAKDILDDITEKRAKFYTSNYVLAETYTLMRIRVSHRSAVKFMEEFPFSGVDVLRINESIEAKAKDIFKKYPDTVFSFVDCTSFALIEEENIEASFAFDEHFKQFPFSHYVRYLTD